VAGKTRGRQAAVANKKRARHVTEESTVQYCTRLLRIKSEPPGMFCSRQHC